MKKPKKEDLVTAVERTNVSIHVNKDLFDKFSSYCKENSLRQSRVLELFMEGFIMGQYNYKETLEKK